MGVKNTVGALSVGEDIYGACERLIYLLDTNAESIQDKMEYHWAFDKEHRKNLRDAIELIQTCSQT